MEIESRKGRNPELLMDWNGHPVQCFPLGGDTVEVTTGSTFKTKSTLVRVANIDPTNIVYLKLSSLGVADPGVPILSNTSEMFSVRLGEIYEVTGASLFVTFIRDRNA